MQHKAPRQVAEEVVLELLYGGGPSAERAEAWIRTITKLVIRIRERASELVEDQNGCRDEHCERLRAMLQKLAGDIRVGPGTEETTLQVKDGVIIDVLARDPELFDLPADELIGQPV